MKRFELLALVQASTASSSKSRVAAQIEERRHSEAEKVPDGSFPLTHIIESCCHQRNDDHCSN